MARNLKLQLQEEARIKARWKELKEERTAGGALKHNHEAILEMVSTEFLKMPKTIEQIVYGEYDARRERDKQKKQEASGQQSLFDN